MSSVKKGTHKNTPTFQNVSFLASLTELSNDKEIPLNLKRKISSGQQLYKLTFMKLDHLINEINTHLKTLFVREKTRQNVTKKGETGDFSNADRDQKISEQSVLVPVLVFLVKPFNMEIGGKIERRLPQQVTSSPNLVSIVWSGPGKYIFNNYLFLSCSILRNIA